MSSGAEVGSGGPTILLDLFLTNQRRKRMIEAALAQAELPAEDYPVYVLVGAEGPWTPTGLAKRLEMPLSTMLFRLGCSSGEVTPSACRIRTTAAPT
jgi:hypothetical protein